MASVEPTARLRRLVAEWLFADEGGCDCPDSDYYSGPSCLACRTRAELACDACGGWGQDTTDGNTTFACVTCNGTTWAADVREVLAPKRKDG